MLSTEQSYTPVGQTNEKYVVECWIVGRGRSSDWARGSTSATLTATVIGSSEPTRTTSARDPGAGQPAGVTSADSDDHRRAVPDLVRELMGLTGPTGEAGVSRSGIALSARPTSTAASTSACWPSGHAALKIWRRSCPEVTATTANILAPAGDPSRP